MNRFNATEPLSTFIQLKKFLALLSGANLYGVNCDAEIFSQWLSDGFDTQSPSFFVALMRQEHGVILKTTEGHNTVMIGIT